MKNLLSIGLVLGCAGALGAQTKEYVLPANLRACLVEAERANTRHDLEGERAILLFASELEGPTDESAEVQRRLAVLDWKYHGRFDAARERLARVIEGPEAAGGWLALARLEFEARNYSAARVAASQARTGDASAAQRRSARLWWNKAAVREAVELRLAGELGHTDDLRPAFEDLHAYVGLEPGYLDPSRELLQAALLLDDGRAALAAWGSYFHASPGDPSLNAIADAGRALLEALDHWRGPVASAAERVELVEALAGTRFYEETLLVVRDPRAPSLVEDARVRDIVLYAEYIRDVRDLSLAYYRQVAVGEFSTREYKREWERRTAELVGRLQQREEPRRFSKAMLDELERRFGTHVMRSNDTSIAYDVFMGHAVVDQTREVEQYGRKAKLRFVAVDTLVSNGFVTWAWENGGMNGGWGGTGGMWQVRPAYAGGPLAVWREFSAREKLDDLPARLRAESAGDDARASEDPHAYLPGLALRLQHQGIARLVERLRGEGLEGRELRAAFVAAYEAAVQESSIFAHEGRHAIDARAGRSYSAWRSEYHAKLSQVAFAPEVRLSFGGIFFSNIGDGSPHGRANLEFVEGAVAWMEQHTAEIEGFDPDRPLLPQFDQLTDEQMRAVARSLDPLASP